MTQLLITGCVCMCVCVCVAARVKDSVLICLICFLAEAVWLQSIKFKTRLISWINLVLLRLNFRSNWILQCVLCYMSVVPQTCWSSQNTLFTQETFLGSLRRCPTERLNWTDSPGAGWGSMDGKLLRGSIKARWNLTQLKWRDSSQKWTRVFRHWGWGMRNLIKDNQISKVGDICYTDAAGFLRLEKWAKGRA